MTNKDSDGFGPPTDPIDVHCLHCGQKYRSDKMVFEMRHGGQELWRCATPDCDGRGFGFDIYPVGEMGG